MQPIIQRFIRVEIGFSSQENDSKLFVALKTVASQKDANQFICTLSIE